MDSIVSAVAQTEVKHNTTVAVIYGISSQLFYVIMLACTGLLKSSYSTFDIVYGRMVVSLVIAIVVCKYCQIQIYPTNNVALRLVIFRAILASITQLLYVHSYRYLALSDMVVIAETNPIWTFIFASYFLGEKITLKKMGYCFLALFGLILIVRPSFLFGDESSSNSSHNQNSSKERNQFLGCLYALIGSFAQALGQIIIRKVQHIYKYHNTLPLLYVYFTAPLFSALLQMNEPNDSYELTSKFVYLIIIIGTTGYCSHFFFSRAFTLKEASFVSPLQYSQIIFSYIIDIFFFKEDLYISSILGAIVILCSCLGIILQK